MLGTWIRRTAKAAFVGALAALVAAWFRDRDDESATEEPGEAEWPPLDLPDPVPAPPTPAPVTAPEPMTAAAPVSPGRTWVDPDADGDCPATHPVKAKLSSGIYHVPGGASYDRTNADRCYCTSDDAESDGYRASKT